MKRGIEDYAKDAIRRLVPGVQDAGFLRTILEASWREDFADDEVVEVDSGEPSLAKAIYIRNMSEEYRIPFLCDMYFVAPELQTYCLYEIEDTNPISREKLQKLRRWIDYFGGETEWAGGVSSSLTDGAIITAACIITRRARTTGHQRYHCILRLIKPTPQHNDNTRKGQFKLALARGG
jgi:hypothetical protein